MEKLLELIRLISDPTRYRILKILEERPAYTCEIAEVLGLSPSTVSAHLSKLKYFSIVKEKKFGVKTLYSLTIPEELKEIITPILQKGDRWKIVEIDRKKLKSIKLDEICPKNQ